MSKEFVVVHPIRHNGKPYNRGERIAAEKLSEKESARLVRKGVIAESGVGTVVVKEVIREVPGAIPTLTSEQLAEFTVVQLYEYARGRYNLTPKSGLNKTELLSEIAQAAQAGADLKAAAEQGQ